MKALFPRYAGENHVSVNGEDIIKKPPMKIESGVASQTQI